MAKGYKTGGRKDGSKNKEKPLKGILREHSMRYYEPTIEANDEDAELLHVPVGTVVSRLDLDLAQMSPAERVVAEEKLLRYHTPQMSAVSADVAVQTEQLTIEVKLAKLAGLA